MKGMRGIKPGSAADRAMERQMGLKPGSPADRAMEAGKRKPPKKTAKGK